VNEELKACPFCGGTDIKEIRVHLSFWHECLSCGARGPLDSVSNFEKNISWNSRPREKSLQELFENNFKVVVHQIAKANNAMARAKLVDATIARIEELENRVI
jgi:hypothetical protein